MRVEDHRPIHAEDREGGIIYILQRVWTYEVSTKSDEARRFADEFAEAASRGLVTTNIVPGGSLYGRIWKLTPKGLKHLFDNADHIRKEEDAYVKSYLEKAKAKSGSPD